MTPVRHTSMLMTLVTMVLAMLGSLLFTGCNKNDEPDNFLYQDIVTVTSVTSSGCSFTVTPSGQENLVTLTTTQTFDATTYPVGSRVLITYAYVEAGVAQYTSGQIVLAGIAKAYGGEYKTGTAAQYRNWATDPMTVLAMLRSGDYVNIQALMWLNAAPKSYDLVLDVETEDTECPTFYVILDSDASGSQAGQYMTYASFNIGGVWNNPNTEQVKIIYCDQSGLAQNVTIVKNPSTIRPSDSAPTI